MSERYTLAEVRYRKYRINHRILFGEPERYIRRDWKLRLAAFLPGQVFGYERWMANGYGTQAWSIVVCRATDTDSFTTYPGLFPGADIWLQAVGLTRVKRVFSALDCLRDARLPPENLPERRWRALHLANQQAQDLVPIVERWSC